MPLMWSCYMLQYLDKTLINYANVMGLQKDVGISPGQYSQLAMIFYVSYLGFEFPHAYGMQRLPTAKYLGVMVFLWGVAVATTSAANSWGGLVTTRVFLGVFESAVAPSLILITTMWYVLHTLMKRVTALTRPLQVQASRATSACWAVVSGCRYRYHDRQSH